MRRTSPRTIRSSTAKVELGRLLYFDKRLSKDDTDLLRHLPRSRPTASPSRARRRRASAGRSGARNSPTVHQPAVLQGAVLGRPRRRPRGAGARPAHQPDRDGDGVARRGVAAKVESRRATAALREGVRHARDHHRRDRAGDRVVRAHGAPGQQPVRPLPGRRQGGAQRRPPCAAWRSSTARRNCETCHAGFNFTDESYHNLGVGMRREGARPRAAARSPRRRASAAPSRRRRCATSRRRAPTCTTAPRRRSATWSSSTTRAAIRTRGSARRSGRSTSRRRRSATWWHSSRRSAGR